MDLENATTFDTFDYNGDMDYVKDEAVCLRIKKVFDHFEQKEAEYRAECQEKISESNLIKDNAVHLIGNGADVAKNIGIHLSSDKQYNLYIMEL